MKFKHILLFFLLIPILSCKVKKEAEIKRTIFWKFGNTKIDSTQNHTGIFSKTNCFPGFLEYENNFTNIVIKIYSRWGVKVYESTDISENWICNTQEAIPASGSYYFRIITESKNQFKKDTFKNSILVFKYRK